MSDADEVIDEQLIARYRSVSHERVPPSLDRTVLRAASRNGGAGRMSGWLARWIKPAGYVAMVALSLAVVLEFNEVGILSSPYQTDERLPGGSENAFESAGHSAIEQIRDATNSANNAMQDSVSLPDMPVNAAAGDDPGTTLLPDSERCDPQQRTSVATWWQCIQSLESKGASAAAEQELTALMRAFPGFVPPE